MELTNEIKVLGRKFLKEQEYIVHSRVDRHFRALLEIEWVFGVLCALFISPLNWAGEFSQPHIHLWTAFFLGGLIVAPPIILVSTHPGTKLSRYTIAVSQTLFGALLIHLMGGRIEAHFYIFGSLAFLAAYRDPKVLLPAIALVALDHLIRGVLWPQSVYGVLTASKWRWMEHLGWLVFEGIFLYIALKKSQLEAQSLAYKRAEVQIYSKNIESLVEEKTLALEDERAKLQYASRMAALGEMAGGIAHEINNPLAVIALNVRAIKNAMTSNSLKEDFLANVVSDLEDTTKRISRIIQGLRNISRDSEGVSKTPVSLEEIFEDVLSLCSERFKQNGIKLITNLGPDIPTMQVLCDRIQLSQVLLNLVNNAFDAVQGLASPWVRLQVDEGAENVQIRVMDSGSGIDQSIQEKMFTPFYTSKEVGKGTGLGLSISASIMKKHGGSLTYDNISGNTCFLITLPIEKSTY